MQQRLQGLERIALVYLAVKHAQALSLEQAATSLRHAETLIDHRNAQATRLNAEGKAALDVGDHVVWQMQESEKHFTEWNSAGLAALRLRREELMLEAAEIYREGHRRAEQMESVLREVRSELAAERSHRAQRESDDRFLARQWWDARRRNLRQSVEQDEAPRMKSG